MESIERIAKAGFIVSFGIGFDYFFKYLFRLLVARLDARIYGLYSVGFSVISVLISLAMVGLGEGIVRFVSFHLGRNDREGVNRVVSETLQVVVPLSLLFMVVVFSFSDEIAFLLHDKNLSTVFKVFSFLLPVWVLLNVYSAVNIAYKRMEYFVLARNIVGSFSKTLFLLAFIYLGFGLVGVLASLVLSFVLSLLCLVYFTRDFFSFRFVRGLDRELFSYSWPLLFMTLAISLTGGIDTIMIAYFSDTVSVGVYNTAYPTAALLSLVPAAVLSVFLPTVTEKFAKNERISDDYRTVTRWIFLINLPIAVLMVFYSKELIGALFGGGYVAAAPSLSILGFAFFVNSFTKPSYEVLKMLKKTRFLLGVTLLQIVVNTVLNYLLIPSYGIIGAAIATALGYLLISSVNFIAVYHLTNIMVFDVSYIKPVFSVLTSWVLFYGIGGYGVLDYYSITHVLLLFAVFLCAYVALLFALNAIPEEDRHILAAMRNKVTSAAGYMHHDG